MYSKKSCLPRLDATLEPMHPPGMDALYGVTFNHGLPFAATLGNHDGQADLSREKVVQYFSNPRWGHGLSHAVVGPAELQAPPAPPSPMLSSV